MGIAKSLSTAEILDSPILSEVRDPYPMFAEMRRNQPVFAAEVQGRPIYLVLRYDDVCSVLRDPETFSSSVMRQVMGPVMGRTILEMDGGTHTVHRGLVANAFRPQSIRRYAEKLVQPVVDAVRLGDPFVYISELNALAFRHPGDWMMLALSLAAVFTLGWRRTIEPLPVLVFLFGCAVGFRARC